MKRIFALLLAVVMVFGLAACAGNNTTTGNTTTTGKTETPTTGKTETPTTGKTETPTTGETETPTTGATDPEPTDPEATDPEPTDPDYNALLAGDYGTIKLWVSESEGVKEQFESQIAAFQAKYPDIKFTAQIDVISEADAASQVITDVASAPDIYCFAQDQLTRLVQSAALSAPSGVLIDSIKAENSEASVNAASVAGTLYAYPLTADNGYFMYYDTSILTAEDVEDLATMISKVEPTGKKIRFALENAWYTASFFYATGCSSVWSMNDEGKWTGVEDDFNSDKGLIAMKGMQILTGSTAYDSNADIFTDAAVIVTGTWNAKAAAAHFGDNLGATDLPSFTVDGESYHLASYRGCKLMGVKPQSDVKKQNVLHLLAQYLTNEENQLARFESFGWGPSNIAAQANEGVLADLTLQALTKQDEHAVMQGNINGSWWDIAKLLGADAKNATSEDDLRNALKEYEDAIKAVLTKSDEELQAWGVIGSICGTNWDTDFKMTKQEDGSFLSDVLELNEGDEFKVRQGGSWDVNYGVGGAAGGDNIVVETTGKYQVKLTIDGANVTIELIPAE